MEQKEFIQSINNVIMACGNITEACADAVMRNFDFVDVPTEVAEDCITIELTCMCNYAADGKANEVYNCAKRIQEVMRDCHMI